MTTHIGLLRAVNLPGHNKIGMADLRELLAALGMQDVRSLLQSGNVVFRNDVHTATQLERVLEHAAAKRLGLETDFFVRTASDWKAIVAVNPFPDEAERDPGHLLVVFLKGAPRREDVTALKARSRVVRSSAPRADRRTSCIPTASVGRVSRAPWSKGSSACVAPAATGTRY